MALYLRGAGCPARFAGIMAYRAARRGEPIVARMGDVLWHGLWHAFLMAWEVWWALVLGFFISAVVQAWVPRERVESALSGEGLRPVATATGLGAASSSCSYAAIAIARSLFEKGAGVASALA